MQAMPGYPCKERYITYPFRASDTPCAGDSRDTPRIICGMETWYATAKARMRQIGLTQEDLAAALGVTTRGAVGHYLSGRRQPSPEQMKVIADQLRMSLDRLMSGKGAAIHQEGSAADAAIVRPSVSPSETPPGYVRVAQLDVPAGAGPGGEMEAEPEVVRWLDVAQQWADEHFPRRIERMRVVTARGDSMVGAGIMTGDLLFVDTGIRRYDGDGYYVLRYRDGWQVKRLRADVISQQLEVVSMLATREEARPITPEQEGALTVAGKVAAWWTLRKY